MTKNERDSNFYLLVVITIQILVILLLAAVLYWGLC